MISGSILTTELMRAVESCELSVEEASESGGMRQGGRWRFDTLFDGDLERAFQSELNFARRFLARVAVCHDTGPFDNLGDEAFVTFFRRIPNPDFIVARVGLHGVSSSWFQIQILQLLPHLPYLIGLCFSACSGLQIQETRTALKDDVATFRLARIVAKFRQKGAEVIKGEVCIASSGNELV